MSEGKIDRRRLLIPALGGLYELGAPYAYAFMRFATGAVLVPHGIQKMFFRDFQRTVDSIATKHMPLPVVLAVLVIFTESFAAAFLALGLFTRVAAAMIWVQMLVIIIFYQWPYGYFWTQRGIEYPLLWVLLTTAIFFRGGGRYSLDRVLGKEI
jgi:putative oxidoreductase